MSTTPSVFLNAAGHFHPENYVENQFFDSLDIGSEGTWIKERTGIEGRHSVLTCDQIRALRNGEVRLEDLRAEGGFMGVGELGAAAVARMKERITASAEKLVEATDLLLCGTSVPDYDIPASGALVAKACGLGQVATFDVNSACSSFVAGLHVARSLILAGAQRNILLANPERYSLRLDYTDRNSCVLFGDGSSAVQLSSENLGGGLQLIDTYLASEPEKYDLVRIPVGEHFYQNGKAVQKFAISKTVEAARMILEKNGLGAEDVSYFIGHQANLRMLNSAAAKLEAGGDRHLFNVDKRGNQGGAGAGCVLSENWDTLKPGDLLVISVVGSGLTWGSALLRKT